MLIAFYADQLDRSFRTLPFEIILSNLDSRVLKTYPRTSGRFEVCHFMAIPDLFEYFPEKGSLRISKSKVNTYIFGFGLKRQVHEIAKISLALHKFYAHYFKT